jgi:hypothetical protein
LNPENATTHPSWPGARHARTRLKSPPRSLPFFTSTFPPSSSAETSFRRIALRGSISSRISRRSTNVPCEWPTNTTPRPSLKRRR